MPATHRITKAVFELVRVQEDPEPLGGFEQITLPFRRVENLMVLEVEIDGQIGNFLLDIGAPYLVLNKTYFRCYIPSDAMRMGGINGDG